jgi:quinohemoprotein ethanol dehydrogenase
MAAHTWHPMSYSPRTGLVYLSAQEQGSIYARLEDGKYKYQPGPGRTNSGESFNAGDPELRKKLQQQAKETEKGYLLAWNPATQSEAWRVDYGIPGSGGVLATAGNLLIQPTIKKTVAIYRADNGKKLWEMNVDQAGVAGPITYMIDGEQYIAVNVGWGGSPVMNLPSPFRLASAKLLVFKLGGAAKLPPLPAAEDDPVQPTDRVADDVYQRGAALYGDNCGKCHGDNAVGGVKDLRKMSARTRAAFLDIVLKGTREDKGMPSFAGQVSEAQAKDIYGYLAKRAQDDW